MKCSPLPIIATARIFKDNLQLIDLLDAKIAMTEHNIGIDYTQVHTAH